MNTLKYIQRVKIVFTVCMLLIVGVSAFSIMLLDDNIYLSKRYLLSTKDYLLYSFEYYRNSGVAQAASSGYVYTGVETQGEYERNLAEYVPVLVYHRIIDKPDGFNVTKEAFKSQLFALKQNGYNTISLENLLSYIRGERELPAKSIVITFDDGSKDSFYNSDPILRVLGFRAVNFVITEHSLNDNLDSYYLNKQELKAMAGSGRWEIGSHTNEGHGQIPITPNGDTGNFLTNRMWLPEEDRLETIDEYEQRVDEDLKKSKQEIETELNAKVIAFAFPYGDYGYDSRNVPGDTAIIKRIVSDIFPMNFYQPFGRESATNTPSTDKSFYVKRISVRPDWTVDDILKKLSP
jgi:poly-beta-1,6-N-acetyl-D-glucosamine N-deacetylase